jgi:hypothetical protein
VRTVYESSVDGKTWSVISEAGTINPMLVGALDVLLHTQLTARYVRVRHVLVEGATAKVFVWEISAWGVDGKYGTLPPPTPNLLSFKKLFGVNGIWGWGTNQYSSSLSTGKGADRYAAVASHGRDYHNWNWDVTDPDNYPRYDQMVAPGSLDYGVIPGHSSKLAFDWLNWDNEYTAWKKSGLEVQVSLQFTEKMFPREVFNRLSMAAYRYGYAFASHFGSLNGTGDVKAIELGNEPWDYPAYLYNKLYRRLAKGIKDADPNMLMLPAAFESLGAFMQRIDRRSIGKIDALNVHSYSWLQTNRGRTGIYPEHKMSTLHTVNSYIRFRDAMAPGLPIFLTEWGWDSAGGGETCAPPAGKTGDFPECVSEAAQAAYAIRGALVLARKGLSRLTWFFYGNTVQTASSWDTLRVFSRSGLTSSSVANHQDKQSMRALQGFMGVLGDTHFLSIINEDEQSYVYVLGVNGVPTHIVAWRPIDADDASTSSVTFSVLAAGASPHPKQAQFLGLSALVDAELPSVVGNSWTMTLSAFPVVVALE